MTRKTMCKLVTENWTTVFHFKYEFWQRGFWEMVNWIQYIVLPLLHSFKDCSNSSHKLSLKVNSHIHLMYRFNFFNIRSPEPFSLMFEISKSFCRIIWSVETIFNLNCKYLPLYFLQVLGILNSYKCMPKSNS